MDYQFLPNKLREILSEEGMPSPEIALRASNCPDSDSPGETYLVSAGDELRIFSRPMGESDYRQWRGEFHKNIQSMNLEEERFSSFLVLNLDGREFKLKYSSFEAEKLRPLLDRFNGNITSPAESAPPPLPEADGDEEVESLHPFCLLVAGLMYAAGADGELGETEERYIRNITAGRDELLEAGTALYQQTSFEDYLEYCKLLDGNSRLCILAQMTDLTMGDGILHSSEQELLKQYAAALNISDVNFRAVHDVMLIKNRLSLFF
jgi:uncharacterized tellurite resistance protein B-like protein